MKSAGTASGTALTGMRFQHQTFAGDASCALSNWKLKLCRRAQSSGANNVNIAVDIEHSVGAFLHPCLACGIPGVWFGGTKDHLALVHRVLMLAQRQLY
jgi:hypothetical protein